MSLLALIARVRSRPEDEMPSVESWRTLAERIYAKGVDVFNSCSVTPSEDGPRDPKVVALTLLARTLSTFEAATMLIDNGHVVEARTLARCSHENLFWAAALVKEGEAFVERMELHDAANRLKAAQNMLDWAKGQAAANTALNQKLDAFRQALIADFGKDPPMIGQLQAAMLGGVADGYIAYRQLSGDAAHPSAWSLSRHVSWDKNASLFSLHATPILTANEAQDTYHLLCSATLAVVVAAHDMVGPVGEGETLDALWSDFKVLSTAEAQVDAAADRT